MLAPPIDIQSWLRDHADLLQPPVNNHCLYNEDFIVMIIGGPNKRSDYHINPTPEFFYQVSGDMLLRVVDGETFRDIPIKQGCLFLLPGNTPHNPVRFANTVGLVIEQRRPVGQLDTMRWYCDACHARVYEESFYCTNLGTQLKPVIEKWATQPELRQCKQCGFANPAKV